VSNKNIVASLDLDQQNERNAVYDEYLFEKAKNQWNQGNWAYLCGIKIKEIESNPDRAKLSLMAAIGRLQNGEIIEGKKYILLALEWGLSKDLVGKILISCVYNTLGRAQIALNEKSLAREYFLKSIMLSTPRYCTKTHIESRLADQSAQVLKEIKLLEELKLYGEDRRHRPNIEEKIITQSKTINIDTTGANILIKNIYLSEWSKKRWPYFLKIEEIQISVFLTLIKETAPSTLFDIGANVGFYTLIAQKYFPNICCLSFEPSPETYQNLIINLNANKKQGVVRSFPIALSEQKETVEFGDFGDCSGKNSIISTSIHDKSNIKKHLHVETDFLDNIHKGKNGRFIVKIDTEGHEINVIKGGSEFFKNNEIILQVETGHKESIVELDDCIKSYSLELLFTLGPDSYYTNIKSLNCDKKKSEILSRANQFMISHRWDHDFAI